MAHAWKACWVQALGGSNPPSSATGPRDSLEPRGFPLRAQGKPRPAQTEALWLRAAGAPSGRSASPRDGARTMRGACGPPPSPRGARSVNSARFPPSAAAPLGWSARSGERVHWRAVLRVTVSSEPPQGRNAARIRVRCRVRGGSSYSPGHSGPPPVPPRRPRERAPPRWRSLWRLCCRAPRAPAGPLDGLRPRCAQAPRPSTTSAAGSAASSSPGTKSFEARRPDPMQLHPLAQRESMRRRH